MNTTAHLLLAAALTAKPGARKRNAAMVCGALIPDALLFVFIGWQRWIAGRSFDEIFRVDYFRPDWQGLFALGNSIPLYAALFAVAWWRRWQVMWVFALCALLHVLLDLPLHHDDGHSHFWPFTMWKFESPVSYWDPAHHGTVAGVVELGLCLGLGLTLWRRFHGIAARVSIALTLAAEALLTVGAGIVYGFLI